jgi:hypothetical protein
MQQGNLEHFLEYSIYTNPGLYRESLLKLPDDVRELGLLLRKNIIHRTTLVAGNTGTNADLRFGDMTKVPWWRQPEDDILPTVSAMLAELYRRDDRGFVVYRTPENKLVVTCRFVAILMASILKTKGIPARVRSGNASYFNLGKLGKVSTDHWINQYWNKDQKRWVTIDVDGSLSLDDSFDPYDIPEGKFDFSAKAWLEIRSKKIDEDHFVNADGNKGAMVVVWSLFHDFHSLMNDEIIYVQMPEYGTFKKFPKLTEVELSEIDELARLMLDPDENLDKLMEIWNTNRKFRLLQGGLL